MHVLIMLVHAAYAPLATSGTNVTLSDDQVSGAIPIGFNFTFFCNNYTNAYISSTNFVTFNSTSGWNMLLWTSLT